MKFQIVKEGRLYFPMVLAIYKNFETWQVIGWAEDFEVAKALCVDYKNKSNQPKEVIETFEL